MEKKIKVAFFSANRAEYSLIRPFIKKFSSNNKFKVDFIISGSHLNKKFGRSFDEIKLDKIKSIHKIIISLNTNRLINTVKYFNLLQKRLSKVINKINPDIVFISSDRFETMSFAITSYLMKIPIIHYEGGDVTEGGALDDNIRHAITKLSNIHLTSNLDSLKRLIKMGEEKWRCINIGYSPIALINKSQFNLKKISKIFNLQEDKTLLLFTFHPLVLEKNKFESELYNTFKALSLLEEKKFQIIITYPNFDPGYERIINEIKKIKSKRKNVKVFKNLGTFNYHSLLYYMEKKGKGACVGNSSSGIKETIIFNVPTVNIGQRQKSRLKPSNVINVEPNYTKIISTLNKLSYLKKKNYQNPYQLTKNYNNLTNKVRLIIKNKSFSEKKCKL